MAWTTRTRRWLLTLLGTLCVGLGVLGAVLPGLPATVFFLAAAWLYARSCPALERRLREHPRIGPLLRAVEERRMPRRTKAAALLSLWIAVTASWLFLGGWEAHPAPRWGLPLAALAGSLTILVWVRTATGPQSAPPVSTRS
jgi:uncharacterized membrane protein YbaN (DUF454 family)